MRLIDAKEFDFRVSEKLMSEVFPNWVELPKEVQDAVCKHGQYLHMMLETQPTVDAVEVVHGRWMKTCLPDIYHCTNCKRATKMDELCDSEILRAYCPNCGADMR